MRATLSREVARKFAIIRANPRLEFLIIMIEEPRFFVKRFAGSYHNTGKRGFCWVQKVLNHGIAQEAVTFIKWTG